MPADRPNGDRCHAFAALKGVSRERISAVAEVVDSEPLRSALVLINERGTPFFTIGCEKDITEEDAGWRMGGYIEFAFNYPELARDAASYFPVYFHFDRVLKEQDLSVPVQFQWELARAKFLDASGAVGYTAIVWVRTGNAPSRDELLEVWAAAVDVFAHFLATYPTHGQQAIYPRASAA